MLNKQGFSLIEVIVIIAIMAILLAIGIPALSKYVKSYNVRNEINRLYSDLMKERVKAIETGIPRGVVFNSLKSYTVFVFNDTNHNLQFDGNNEELNPVNTTLSVPLNGPTPGTVIMFDNMGVSRTKQWGLGNFTVYINSPARYNCLVISSGRIRKGVWSNNACESR